MKTPHFENYILDIIDTNTNRVAYALTLLLQPKQKSYQQIEAVSIRQGTRVCDESSENGDITGVVV